MSRRDLAVNVKVLLEATGVTKTMRFLLDSAVAEVIKEIRVKTEVGGLDHGLFFAGNLQAAAKSTLHFKKMHRPLTIILVDDTKKIVVVDDTLAVSKVVSTIDRVHEQALTYAVLQIGLKSWEEFSLRKASLDAKGIPTPSDWLYDDQTMPEQNVKDSDELFFLKRYYFNDDYVDKDDPFSLHLLFVGANKMVVNGEYLISKNEARDFAALQLQVNHGDFDKEKEKDGLLEPVKYFPPYLRKEKKLEKEVFSEYKKLAGMSQINAKLRYVQYVRQLKSYGITYFDCRWVQKGKKPEKSRLGVTRTFLILQDAKSLQVLKEWNWEMLSRWTHLRNEVTLDFGEYEDGYINLLMEEADSLSTLLGGYIDLMLRTHNDAAIVLEDDETEYADIEDVAPQWGLANMGHVGDAYGMYTQAPGLASKLEYQPEIGSIKASWSRSKGEGKSENDWLLVFNRSKDDLAKEVNTVIDKVRTDGPAVDKKELDLSQLTFKTCSGSMINAAKTLESMNNSYGNMLDGAEILTQCADAFSKLVFDWLKDPEKVDIEGALVAAEKMFQEGELLDTFNLVALIQPDASASIFLKEIVDDLGRHIEGIQNSLESAVTSSDKMNAEDKKAFMDDVAKLKTASSISLARMKSLSPFTSNPDIAKKVKEEGRRLQDLADAITHRATQKGIWIDVNQARQRVANSVDTLANGGLMSERKSVRSNVDFSTPLHNLVTDLARIRGSMDSVDALITAVKSAAKDQNDIIAAIQDVIASAKQEGDNETKDRMVKSAAELTNTMQRLLDKARAFATTPSDTSLFAPVVEVVGAIEKQALVLLNDMGAQNALMNLRHAAKTTAASLIRFSAIASKSSKEITDLEVQDKLAKDIANLSKHISDLIAKVKGATEEPRNFDKQNALLEMALFAMPALSEYVSDAKKAVLKIDDASVRRDLDVVATAVSNNLRLLATAVANVSNLSCDSTHEAALGGFDISRADLESALYLSMQGRLPPPSASAKESAFAMFTLASQQLADALKVLRNDAIKGYGSGLSGAIKDSASAFSQIAASVRTLSGAISVDRTIQKDVISSALKCLDSAIDSIAVHRALAADHVLGSNQVAAERSYFAFESTLADLRAVISGNVIGLLKEAIALLTEARAAFIGDELTAATISVIDVALALKSMALAIILLGESARAARDSVGNAGRVAAASCSMLLVASMGRIGSCEDKGMKTAIKSAADDVTAKTLETLKALLAIAEIKGSSKEDEGDLSEACTNTQTAIAFLSKLLNVSSSDASDIDLAIASITSALSQYELDQPGKSELSDGPHAVARSLKSFNEFQSAVATLLALHKESPQDLGKAVPRLIEAAGNLINFTKRDALDSALKLAAGDSQDKLVSLTLSISSRLQSYILNLIELLRSLSKSDPNEVELAQSKLADPSKLLLAALTELNPLLKLFEYILGYLKLSSLDLHTKVLATEASLSAADKGNSTREVVTTALLNLMNATELVVKQSSNPKELLVVLPELNNLQKIFVEALKSLRFEGSFVEQQRIVGVAKGFIDRLMDVIKSIQSAALSLNSIDITLSDQVNVCFSAAREASTLLATYLRQGGAQSLDELVDFALVTRKALASLDDVYKSPLDFQATITDLQIAVRGLTTKMTTLLCAEKWSSAKVIAAAQELALSVAPLVAAVNASMGSAKETAFKKELLSTTRSLGENCARMIEQSKAFAEGGKDGSLVLSPYKEASAAAQHLLVLAEKGGAIGDLMLEKAMEQTGRVVAQATTAAMFANASQLDRSDYLMAHRSDPLVTPRRLTENVVTEQASLSTAINELEAAAREGDEKLGDVAAKIAVASEKEMSAVVVAAARLPKGEQKMVLAAAKEQALQSQNALTAARALAKTPTDGAAAAALTKAVSGVHFQSKALRLVFQSASRQKGSLEHSIETQRHQIRAVLEDLPAEPTATPQDVVKATHDVIQASADLCMADTPEATIDASQKAFVAVHDLVSSGRQVKKTATSPEVERKVDAAMQRVGQAVADLLETTKQDKTVPEVSKKIEQQSEQISSNVHELLTAVKALPNTENIAVEPKPATLPSDLDAITEQELAKAARAIADATQQLLASKPLRSVPKKETGVIDKHDVEIAVHDAAASIATATGGLVRVAAAAQEERLRMVQEGPHGKKYLADPFWANGLVSAAQNIANSVTNLVKNAGASADSETQHETLVVAAKSVASATAHLVAASRSKGVPDSDSQRMLREVAKSVSAATTELVAAAGAAQRFKEEIEIKEELEGVDMGTTLGKAKELEIQMAIIRLEKDLDKERLKLTELRKARYAKPAKS